MSLFSRTPRVDLALIIDVQSSVVRAAIAAMRPDAIPHILVVRSANVPYKQGADASYLIKTTLRAIDESISDAIRDLEDGRRNGSLPSLPRKLSSAHFILSSPWIISEAKTLSIDLPHEIKITAEKVSELITTEREKIVSGDPHELSIIEEKVFDVRLNGYSVGEWRDKLASDIDVSFVLSAASSRMVERFKETCIERIPSRRISFHSSLLLQTVGMRVVMPERAAYTLIHVHGELTDVVVIKHHSCVFFGSFPMGIRTIIHKIAKSAKIDPQTAESLMSLYTGDQLDPAHSKAARSVIEEISGGWAAEYRKLFVSSGFEEALPENVFISARIHDAFFRESLRKTHPENRVSLLSIDDVSRHVSFDERIERMRILGICIAALHSLMRQ